jgi:hypothetical protein
LGARVFSILQPALMGSRLQVDHPWAVGLLPSEKAFGLSLAQGAVGALKGGQAILTRLPWPHNIPLRTEQLPFLIPGKVVGAQPTSHCLVISAGDVAFDPPFIQSPMDGVIVLGTIGCHLLGIGSYPLLMGIKGRDRLDSLVHVEGAPTSRR